VKSSSTNWNSPVGPIDHSASQMHNALDHYNNDGMTEDGGTMYAHDTDDASFMTALKIVQDNPIMQVSMQDSMTLQPMII
jgi:outer membrane scaffolding protein for murein synthesis (MipA/OmpV family)